MFGLVFMPIFACFVLLSLFFYRLTNDITLSIGIGMIMIVGISAYFKRRIKKTEKLIKEGQKK